MMFFLKSCKKKILKEEEERINEFAIRPNGWGWIKRLIEL